MDYCYEFRENYKNILVKEYKSINDKINYTDINEASDRYSLFIRKLMYLLCEDKSVETSKFRELFTSNNVLDRLKGLKDSRKYIRLVEVNDAYKKRD